MNPSLPSGVGGGYEGDGSHPVPLLPHPASRLFPPMTATEFAELCRDIAEQGLQDEIVLLDGQILEGNNRYRACQQTGVAPKFTVWDGDDPIAYVISKNLHRRHLTPAQKAAVAVEAEALYAESAKQRMIEGRNQYTERPAANAQQASGKGRAMAHAAQAVGASERSAYDAKKIKAASPQTFEEIKEGTVTSIRAGLTKAGLHPGGRHGGKKKAQRMATTDAKKKTEVAEFVSAQARVAAVDAEMQFRSMLNAPPAKLNLPLVRRAEKIQELLTELIGLDPAVAVTQIPAERCRDFTPTHAEWWAEFTALCEKRRQEETPQLAPRPYRPPNAVLNPVMLGTADLPKEERHLQPNERAALDWLRAQEEPATITQIAVGLRVRSKDAVQTRIRTLLVSGLVEPAGKAGKETAYRATRPK